MECVKNVRGPFGRGEKKNISCLAGRRGSILLTSSGNGLSRGVCCGFATERNMLATSKGRFTRLRERESHLKEGEKEGSAP